MVVIDAISGANQHVLGSSVFVEQLIWSVLSEIANGTMQDYDIPRIVVMSPAYEPLDAYASTSMHVPIRVSANYTFPFLWECVLSFPVSKAVTSRNATVTLKVSSFFE